VLLQSCLGDTAVAAAEAAATEWLTSVCGFRRHTTRFFCSGRESELSDPDRWRVSAACEYCGRLVALLFGCRWWWWWVSGGGGWSVLASPYA
jgi:hypothetical protein